VGDVKVVKLSALKDALPPGTAFVDAAAHEAQLQARTHDYERRVNE
jgi:hypothetical protein